MLCIPAVRTFRDLTIYTDDAVWNRFYAVPSIPSIRRDANGRPIFLLTIFHTSDDRRAETGGASRGGGFINFDAQFAPEPSDIEAARIELQAWVDGEYARRRADPKYAGLPEYAELTAPRVELADPTLSSGSVTMHTTQSELLVSNRLDKVPASLVSGSTAIFNLDLTEGGASFMHELLLDEAGAGRVDLTPIQIKYEMKMWARIPPITITIRGNSERIHQTLTKISQTTRDDVCTPAEVETYRENGTSSASLRETGLIEISIVKGDAIVPDGVLESLQQYALSLFDDLIKERFLVEAAPPASGQDVAPLDAALPVRGKPASRYKVRETLDQSTTKLELKLERSQVVEWPTGGQATLATFFGDATSEQLRRHVVELSADDFESLGVTVRAFVDFEKQPVQALEVQLEYVAERNGRRQVRPGSFTFSAGEPGPFEFDPTIIDDERQYRFRHRVIYDNGTPGDFSTWEITSSRALNIAIADPGKLSLELSGATLNWDIVRGIRTDLAYRDPADAGASFQQSYELTKLTPTRKLERAFNRPIRGQVEVRTTYFLSDDKVIEGPTQTLHPTNTLFIVPPPQVDVLNVSLIPAGIWGDVAQAVVSLEYDAGDGRVYDKTYRFTSVEQGAEWTVLLRDPTRRSFRYKTLVSYKSGGSDDSGWISRTGDQALLVEVKGAPRLRVNVLPNLLDFQRTPAVTVTLTYGDQRKTLAFTAPSANTWDVPLIEGQREYGYTITWHDSAGRTTSSSGRTSDGELFIPRPALPSEGTLEVMVRGFAVDYVATPFVDVALRWLDGEQEQRKTITLSDGTRNDTWSFKVGDRNQRRYHYAITYNLADGTRVPGRQGESEDTVVSVTRLQA